ncbi:MAG: hypothetical protein GYA36_19005 [Veillonellaceae bacterium]|nr:hypothetical protein [Veillonellaceae bacterium]
MSRAHKRSRLVEWLDDRTLSAQRGAEAVVSAVISSVLLPREQWVLRMYDLMGIPLSALAKSCGVSREVMARLHRSACRKLDREFGFVTSPKRDLKDIWKKYLPGAKPWENRKRCSSS